MVMLIMVSILMGVGCTLLLIFLFNMMFRKFTTVVGVNSTGLELKISAFENIPEVNKDVDEQTQTEMIKA